MNHAHNHRDHLQREKEKVEDSWLVAQERLSGLEEEVTQCRAHIDLYKIRLQEEAELKNDLANQIKELAARKAVQEEDHRRRLSELSGQCEQQLRSLRQAHEQEVERLRSEHLQNLSDVRENYHKEASRSKSFYEKELADSKQLDAQEKLRIREDFADRLAEKVEELKLLRMERDGLVTRVEKLSADLEAVRQDLRERTQQLQQRGHQVEAKETEIANLSLLRDTIGELNGKILELQEAVKRENFEKLQLNLSRESLAQQLAALQQTHKELEAASTLLKLENNKLSYVTSDLSTKSETIESISRENEKIRIIQQKLSNELLEQQYRVANLQKELDFAQQEAVRLASEKSAAQQETSRLAEQLQAAQVAGQEAKEALVREREKSRHCEELLVEAKSGLTALTVERDELRRLTSDSRGEQESQREDWERRWQLVVSIVALTNSALADWDESLQSLVEAHGPASAPAPAPLFLQQKPPTPSASSFFSTPSKSSAAPSSSSSARLQLSARPAPGRAAAGGGGRGLATALDQQEQVAALLASPAYLEQQARQDVAILIERISLKFERIQHVRATYQQEAARFLAALAQHQEQTQQAVQAAQQQIALLQQEVSHLQKTFQHSQEVSFRDKQEFQSLKELLVYEHNKSYKELEIKYQDTLIKCETGRLQDDYHQQAIQTLQREKSELQQTISQLLAEKENLHLLERRTLEMNEKFQELHGSYMLLEQDKKSLESQIQQQVVEAKLSQQEKQNLLLENERLALSVNLLKENLAALESGHEALLKENERLKMRQIDPDLAMTLLETHQQTAGSSGRLASRLQQSSSFRGEDEGRAGAGAAQQDPSMPMSLHSWLSTEKRFQQLVARTDEAVARYEKIAVAINNPAASFERSSGTVTRYSLTSPLQQAIIELQSSVQELLAENQLLLGKVLPWISQMKRMSTGAGSSNSYSNNNNNANSSSNTSSSRHFYEMIERLSPVKNAAHEDHLGHLSVPPSQLIGQLPASSAAPRPTPSSDFFVPSRQGLLAARDKFERVTEEEQQPRPSSSSSQLPQYNFNSSSSSYNNNNNNNNNNNSNGISSAGSSGLLNNVSLFNGSRLNNIDKSLQLLAKKLDSFDRGNR